MALIFGKTNIYGINFVNKGVTTSLTQLNYNKTPVWYALTACTIAGTARVGKEWKATTSPSEVQSLCSYQWYRGTSAISGATKDSYTTTTADRGYQLRCLAQIGAAYAWSAYTDKILQDMASCWISGTTKVGQTMTAGISPDGATGTYQWYRGNSAIGSANSKTYTLTESDRGNTVRCGFTGNGNYTGTVTSGNSGTVIQDMSSIWYGSYSQYVGQTITAYVSPSGATGTYYWYREGSSSVIATGQSYKFSSSDRGKRVYCKFVANSNYTGTVQTGYTSYIYEWIGGSAWLSGTAEEGYTLTCSKSNTYDCRYDWYRDGSTLLQSSTSNTYTVQHDDAGHTISCVVVGTGYWSGSIGTSATGIVYGWFYTTGDLNTGVQQQGESGVTILNGKKPVAVRTRWWWAGEVWAGHNPNGYTKFTFHYTDGTSATYSTGESKRDTDCDYWLDSSYQKVVSTFDWELITNVGDGVVRTETQNYPKIIAWYERRTS